ncbi:tetratricopeptide repeat protein [Pseudenhygromyxa sp. WMMC2535]|uniref:tetratricopeptide repeat protein n=1 Tax=Pseudenhygromyxa sp. WMMC2535 TaxID=2712867 RepID=UPI001551FF70|nr:tetratricopeptide repeat protein [Pseudenhygromyxa sp. WMMC2535]NVB41774.1 tetratricopeptide repeat protein [Pseudenhygromyxa sp. WMMC2535]
MTSKTEQSFAAALRAAENAPDSDDAWDHLEELAESLQKPEEVANLYRELLGRGLGKEVFGPLSERAVNFHEEWFGEEPEVITDLLTDIITRDPEATWAFDRLTVTLTAAEQWDQLLGVYDRTLAVTSDEEIRKRLLDDASHVAKDFADQQERAADYMVKLLELDRGNSKLEANLARLLERQERWLDLIDLWRGRLPQLSAVEARSLRVEIAACYLDKLGDSQKAIDELEALLEESAGHEEACTQLERLLEHDSAALPLRRRALSLLRRNYDAAERPEDVIRVLERALRFVDDDEKSTLYRELGSRLSIAGDDGRAMQHYAALLTIDPSDADARKQLGTLAERSGQHDLHAISLVAAAEASEGGQQITLLLEAAHAYRDLIDDAEQAAELYGRVLESDQVDKSAALEAAHSLAELLAEAGEDARRLDVLETLAGLERVAAVRKSILGDAARLAEGLSQADRALSIWQRRLALEAEDVEARDAVIELLAANERWDQLVSALRERAASPTLEQQRRADLVRAAQILADRLERLPEAVSVWLEVRESFGDEPETLDALDALMAQTDRWQELAELLSGSAGAGRERAAQTLTRLGDIHREHLGDPETAARYYAQALGVDASNERAITGLRVLLDVEACRHVAGEALAQAFRSAGDWEAGLEILDERIDGAPDPGEKARLLREAAMLYERRADDLVKAHAVLVRALPFAPEDVALEHDLLRLAKETAAWSETAVAFDLAADAAESKARAAQLLFESGRIQEHHLDAPAAATDAYARAAELDPQRVESQEAVSRCAARAGRWTECAAAALRAIVARERPEGTLIADLESAAEGADAFAELAAAFEQAVDEQRAQLRTTLARALEQLIASWWEKTGDLERATAAARRAVDLEPTHGEALAGLAALQRQTPSPALVDTLLRIDALGERDLDHLREAAKTALALRDAADGDDDGLSRQTLVRLYRKAARMWSRADEGAGELGPDEACRWALEQLVEQWQAAGDLDQAVRLLLDGATLPVDAETSRDMRRRAAEMLAEDGEYGRAIDLYTGVLAEDEPRLEDIARVASLCEEEDRVSELIGLRLRELEMTEDVERRLELRLELSRLTGVLEDRGGRIETLRANLEEHPGHQDSIAALSELLDHRGRYDELANMLEAQAAKVRENGDDDTAASLYLRTAQLAEKRLDDPEQAIRAYMRVVDFAPSNGARDALARLYRSLDRPDEAARQLELRLETTPESERVAIMLKLARARIAAEQREKAVQVLENAFSEAPRNGEVRKLLIRLHRERGDQEALARTLATAATAVGDPNTVVAYAREAAELYEELGTPEVAVPVLERAHEYAPDDRRLKQMLADGLRGAGRLDEARALLEALIESFGRRRSAQRAEVHVRLGRVAHAQGNIEEAIDELEKASKMAAGNVSILRDLAKTAQAAGELDRAERAYRTLLLSLRRGGEETPPITAAEVYLELATIARERGDADKAAELQESVLEAIAEDDAQAPKLQKALRKRGDFEFLRRVLDTRLANVQGRRRARILNQLADVLAQDLGDEQAALEARLEAVETDPSSPPLHDAASELAGRLGATQRYATLLRDRLATMRRGDEALVRCELLLRLAEVEVAAENFSAAAEFVAQAEQTGVRQVDVWRAQARIAGARGDNELQVELLGRLANLGADQAETRADARFRMAEVHLADAETIEEGMSDLNAALEDDPRWGRAALILSKACERHGGDNEALLELYEKVARRCEDKTTLLHCLSARIQQPDAGLERAREAVDLALELEDWEQAEALMLRAVELAESVIDGAAQVDWALIGLAERRREANDLPGAVKWLTEAAEVADLDKVLPEAQKLAEVASDPEGDLTLAVKLYESLFERDTTIRAAWEPLARLYVQLGEVERLERLVEETLDGIQDAKDRNVLRLQLARLLLRTEGRADDAVPILNDVLLEDPEASEANLLLAEHLERSGKTEELIELLRNQLMAAQGRGDAEGIKTMSLELGRRLKAESVQDALDVIRSALVNAPEDPDLIGTLLEWGDGELDEEERAGLMERRLAATEDTAEIAAQALELAELRAAMGDADGELRALETAYERVPGEDSLRKRLEAAYRESEDWAGLVAMLQGVAERAEDPVVRIALLREAAAVQSDQLEDPGAAIESLRKASEIDPDDVGLRIDLAAVQGVGGQAEAAIETLSQTLEGIDDDKLRLQLLSARAKVLRSVDRLAEAIDDLERAYTIEPDGVRAPLEQALEIAREAAAEAGDIDAERGPLFRLVTLYQGRAANDQARELLADWVDRARKDVEALHLLRELEFAAENWEGLTKVASRLVALEAGEAQVDAALLLARACRELGQPGEARKGLEFARRKQPDAPALRAELQTIYGETGAQRELADLLIEEAGATENQEVRLDLLRRAAKLYLALEDAASAAVPLQAILEIEPGDSETVGLLADAYTQSGQYDAAEAIIDAAIEAAPAGRSPELAGLQLRKAKLAEARGDRETQLAMLQAAFANDKQNGFIAAELADLAEVLENWELATKVLRQIALMEGECPISRAMSFVRQGRISLIQGDAKRAVFWARRATKEDPELPEAAALLEEVQG